MTFLHMVYAYQSRNQRSLLRKEINYLIEKYKRNKETKKLQFEIEELRRLRASQINADQNKVTVETVEVKSSAEAEVVLNNALDDIEKEMKIMCEIEIQVDINDFVDNDELDGLDADEINAVESQIKQAEADRRHEEEYAKMELVLQNNLMRTKVCSKV